MVTGAARGIGKGIALVLAEKGADVVLNDKCIDAECEELADDIRRMGRRVLIAAADVSNEDQVCSMFEKTIGEFGGLHILVNNAGTSQNKDVFGISLDDWHFILNTNLTSCFLCAREAMKVMREGGFGRIINISSVVAERGSIHGHLHYTSTKSGMLGLTKTLSRTAAPLGINVNAVAPGIIETELLTATHGDDGIKKLCAEVPLGLGKPRAVGLAVAFLCGEGGDYITGSTIDVNGGMHMR